MVSMVLILFESSVKSSLMANYIVLEYDRLIGQSLAILEFFNS